MFGGADIAKKKRVRVTLSVISILSVSLLAARTVFHDSFLPSFS